MVLYYFVFLILSILLVYLLYYFSFRNKYNLPKSRKLYFQKVFIKIKLNRNPKEVIIDSDKLFHKILLELWYERTFGKILKQNPIVIKDINKIWELHKLRNNLVHDFQDLDSKMLKQKSKEYLKELSLLLKRV